ncbi:MAG: ABC transporter ATP-binding protein [Candidatus Ornithomonoglobus sp.]
MSDIKKEKKRTDGAGKALKRLLSYIKKYNSMFACVLVCIFISSLVGVIGSTFVQTLVDKFITPMVTTHSTDYSGLAHTLVLLGGVYVIGILATFVYQRLMVYVGQGVLLDIRKEMFEHMQSLPISFFDTHSHGDLMSRYTNDTDTLRQMLTQSVPQIFAASMTIICVFCAMLKTSFALTGVVMIFVLIMLCCIKVIGGNSGRYFIKQQKSLGDVNGYIEEMINGQKVIKVFCHEEDAVAEFQKKNDDLFKQAEAANKFANILMPVMNNLGNIEYVAVAMVGAVLVMLGTGGGIGGALTLGGVAAFLGFTKSFTMPISQISQQFNSIIMALAGANRIFDMLDAEPESDEGTVQLVRGSIGRNGVFRPDNYGDWMWEDNGKYIPLRGDVKLTGVDFGYVPDKTVLHDISLYAKPGQKVAFVGSTGAGKTTITNLINRFYDIHKGTITYDGIDINRIKKASLRGSLGIILQDTHLFTGTIRENIRYGRPDATDFEIETAARLTGADELIMSLPEGYDTMIDGSGGSLSQGQCQLIAITRAAVADPPVMIMDEATSSIDTRTEAIVQRGMDALMQGRTVFVIAHRLSTVRNSDVIMVLDHGRIIERGSHDELIAQKRTYYRLYTGAFELD